MPIQSRGYERAVNYAEFSVLLAHAGAEYSVFAPGDFAAVAGPGTREILVQGGSAYGAGIFDVSEDTDPPVLLTGSPVATGNRWDLVVLHRDWEDAETSVQLIEGGSVKSIPARDIGIGTADDQPLWLARFTAGQSAVQELVDVRCWFGSGGVAAKDQLVMSYLTRLGTHLRLPSGTWWRGFDGAGLPTWTKDPMILNGTAAPATTLGDPGDVYFRR